MIGRPADPSRDDERLARVLRRWERVGRDAWDRVASGAPADQPLLAPRAGLVRLLRASVRGSYARLALDALARGRAAVVAFLDDLEQTTRVREAGFLARSGLLPAVLAPVECEAARAFLAAARRHVGPAPPGDFVSDCSGTVRRKSMAQVRATWVGSDGAQLPLLVHLPAGHAAHPRKRWPVVLHLHGAGERGHDLDALLRRSELPRRLEHAPRFPFVVLSPQCPPRTTWGPLVPALLALLDELVPALRGNPARVHVTGCSMGGSGTWALADADPARFASLVPVCASVPPRPGWPARAARLAHVPVWAFHGARDPVLPPRHSQVLAAVHRAAGGRHRLTILPGVGHAAWGPAYGDPRLWRWIARRRRPSGRR